MYRIRHMLLLTLLLIPLLFIGSCANHFIAKEMVKAPNQSLLGAELSRQFERVNNATDDLIRMNGFTRRHVSLGKEAITISYFDIPPGDYGYEFSTRPVPFSEIERTEDSEIKQQSAAERKCVIFIHSGNGWIENVLRQTVLKRALSNRAHY